MPQLDFSTYLPQIFWLFVTFGVLYITMAKVALPRIGEIIEERRDRIAADLDQAERLRAETDEAIASYEKALGDARGEAHNIAQSTRDKLATKADKKRKEVEARLATKLEKSEAKIAKMTDNAMAEVGDIATTTTASLVNLLLGEDADSKHVSQAVKAQLSH
ncbi:MAG: F0F1 ATP synthase subunit B [Rhizobiales bacterium]|nr:F0F1 ATP synthase subunit B [Hyphomicrobiales bacterium]NRB13504.1 F0F1 ATP synthase subunit B [Hyphomicrobiales bacterium]